MTEKQEKLFRRKKLGLFTEKDGDKYALVYFANYSPDLVVLPEAKPYYGRSVYIRSRIQQVVLYSEYIREGALDLIGLLDNYAGIKAKIYDSISYRIFFKPASLDDRIIVVDDIDWEKHIVRKRDPKDIGVIDYNGSEHSPKGCKRSFLGHDN